MRPPFALRREEVRGFPDAAAEPETDGNSQNPQEKGNPPRPLAEGRLPERRGDRLKGKQTEKESDVRPDLGEAPEKRPPFPRGVLEGEENRTAPLAPEGKPLKDPEEDEERRGKDPDFRRTGRIPMRPVARPMSVRVAMSAALRPTRSPREPKNAAPKGRKKKATANVAKDDMREVSSSSLGKKSSPKTSPAAVPYRK